MDALLPPATKLGQGNIFRSMCQEFCPQRGGGACVAGGYLWQGDVHGGGMCMAGGHVWHTCPPPGRYYEIRSMSGRYASYWNAFLFNYFPLVVGQKNTTQCSQRAGRRDECPVIINYQNEISSSSASNSL